MKWQQPAQHDLPTAPAGRFDEARRSVQKAIELALAAGRHEAALVSSYSERDLKITLIFQAF
jgi:hypothetical protein